MEAQHQNHDPDGLHPEQNLHGHPAAPLRLNPLLLLLFEGTCQISPLLAPPPPPPLPPCLSDISEAGAGGGERLPHLEHAFTCFDPSAEIDSQIIRRSQLAVASFNHLFTFLVSDSLPGSGMRLLLQLQRL